MMIIYLFKLFEDKGLIIYERYLNSVNNRKIFSSSLITLLFLIIITFFVHLSWWRSITIIDLIKEDIFYAWKEGVNIINGINPYERILSGDFRFNQKYPTYLPLIYLFSAFLYKSGIDSFWGFINIWRAISFIGHTFIGVTIFYLYSQKGYKGLGFVAAFVLLTGRWSNYVIKVQHLELITVGLLLASLLIFSKKPFISGLLMAGSICLKHFGVIILPIVLIRIYELNKKENNEFRRIFKNYLNGLIAPLIVINTPFMIANLNGFVASLLFPITRIGQDHGVATGVNPTLFGLDGGKIICYVLILYIYWAFSKEKLSIYSSAFLILLLFLQFNTIIFAQYYFWLITFSLLAIQEILPDKMYSISGKIEK